MPSIYVDSKHLLPKRKEHDLYPTQRALIRAGIPFSFDPHYAHRSRQNRTFRILDMGAGDGRWGLHAKAYFQPYYTSIELSGVEIRPVDAPAGYDRWYNTDALEWQPPMTKYDLVVGNPPFNIAHQLIYLAHRVSTGNVLYLLPRDFGGSEARYSGLQCDHPVAYEHVSARRPSFTGDNGTGGTVYSLWHWVESMGEPHAWQTRVFNWELDPADVDPVALALRKIKQKADRDAKKLGVDREALRLRYYENPPILPDTTVSDALNRFALALEELVKELKK